MRNIAIGCAVGAVLALASGESDAARRRDDPAAGRIDTFSAQSRRANRAKPQRTPPAVGRTLDSREPPAGAPRPGVDPDAFIRQQIERSRGHAG